MAINRLRTTGLMENIGNAGISKVTQKLLQRVLMTTVLLLGLGLGLDAIPQGVAHAFHFICKEYNTTLRFEVIDNDNRPVPGATYDIDYAKCVNDEPQRAGTIRITTGPDGRVDVPYPFLHWFSERVPDFVDWEAGYTYLPALSPQAEAHWATYNYDPSFHYWFEYRFPQERWQGDVTQYHMVLKRLGGFLATPAPTTQVPTTTAPPSPVTTVAPKPAPTATAPKVDTAPSAKPNPSTANEQASQVVDSEPPDTGSFNTDAADEAASTGDRKEQVLCAATDVGIVVSDCSPFPVEAAAPDGTPIEEIGHIPTPDQTEGSENLLAASTPAVTTEPGGGTTIGIHWWILMLALGAATAGGTLLATRRR